MTPPAELDKAYRQGMHAFTQGYAMRSEGAAYGFTFCPYGQTHPLRVAFLAGCATVSLAQCRAQ